MGPKGGRFKKELVIAIKTKYERRTWFTWYNNMMVRTLNNAYLRDLRKYYHYWEKQPIKLSIFIADSERLLHFNYKTIYQCKKHAFF